MPEGDTLRKIANFMAPRLTGQRLVRVQLAGVRQPELEGRLVERVWAQGKHLLVALGPEQDSWLLRSHLGMHGSWHSYPPQAVNYARPHHAADVILVTAAGTHYVCFDAQDVDCLLARDHVRDPVLRALGPNLLDATDAAGEDTLTVAMRRLGARPAATLLIDALLDQSIAAGFGNVYKCELPHVFSLPVDTTLAELSPSVRAAIYRRGMSWLAANLGGWARTTTVDRRVQALPPNHPRLYVYARAGQPCLRCQTAIVRADMGRQRRPTYWCPRCQARKAA